MRQTAIIDDLRSGSAHRAAIVFAAVAAEIYSWASTPDYIVTELGAEEENTWSPYKPPEPVIYSTRWLISQPIGRGTA